MPLPFLDAKHTATLMLQKRGKPMAHVAKEHMAEGGQAAEDLLPFQAMAEDILSAIENKSPIDLAKAMKGFCEIAFEAFELEPHDEFTGQPTEGHEDEM